MLHLIKCLPPRCPTSSHFLHCLLSHPKTVVQTASPGMTESDSLPFLLGSYYSVTFRGRLSCHTSVPNHFTPQATSLLLPGSWPLLLTLPGASALFLWSLYGATGFHLFSILTQTTTNSNSLLPVIDFN